MRVPAMGSDAHPIYHSSLFQEAQGLSASEGSNVLASAFGSYRHSDWFAVSGEILGGSNTRGRGWYHIPHLSLEARLFSSFFKIGRVPLRWGQSFVAPLLISDNATPFDSIVWSTLPVEIPFLYRILGVTRAEAFYTRANSDRVNPHDQFFGLRVGTKP